MITVHFVFRPSDRMNQQGSISLRITCQREYRQISLPLKTYTHEWDAKNRTTTNPELNKQLSIYQQLAERIAEQLSRQGSCSLDEVALHFRSQLTNQLIDFSEIVVNYYKKHKQDRTARAYQNAVRRLITFCKCKSLRLIDITAQLIEDFERSLKAEGLAPNTISFYMRNLRTLYNKAVKMQKLSRHEESPFANVFTGTEKTRKRALEREEIHQLNAVSLKGDKKLELAHKLFFFGFHASGMSFVDMAYLKKSDVKNGMISYRRKKTGRIIELKITEALQGLINYFRPLNRRTEYLLPIISDPQKDARQQYESGLSLQNKRLKQLGKRSNLKKILSTHVCRHSWASIARSLNIPIAVISEGLGHSDERTTSIYLASLGRKVLDEVSDKVSAVVADYSLLQPQHSLRASYQARP